MPRYLIERTFEVSADAMPEVGKKSKRILIEQVPEVVWEHSHVLVDDSGTVKTFCVYEAPDEEAVRRHSEALGQHRLDSVREIAGDVTPADFPL